MATFFSEISIVDWIQFVGLLGAYVGIAQRPKIFIEDIVKKLNDLQLKR
jgi:hypothetical protein